MVATQALRGGELGRVALINDRDLSLRALEANKAPPAGLACGLILVDAAQLLYCGPPLRNILQQPHDSGNCRVSGGMLQQWPDGVELRLHTQSGKFSAQFGNDLFALDAFCRQPDEHFDGVSLSPIVLAKRYLPEHR